MKRMRIENPDGSLLCELSDDETRRVMRLAKAKGISPQAVIRQLFKKGHDALIAQRNKVN